MLLVCVFVLVILTQLHCFGREIKDCSNPTDLRLMEDDFSIETKGCKSDKQRQQHCVVNIETMPANYLRLWFTVFNVQDTMPDCLSNFVEIFIGCTPSSIGRFCSEKKLLPHKMFSLDECMTFIYHSNGSSDQMIHVHYETLSIGYFSTVALPDQHLIDNPSYLNSSSGELSSMYWPMMYPEKEFKQTWVITVPEHHSVKLSVMTISLCYNGHQDKCSLNSSSADQLIISNGEEQFQYCGTKKPFSINFNNAQNLVITFITNNCKRSYQWQRGFIIGYVHYYHDYHPRYPISFQTRMLLIAWFCGSGPIISLFVKCCCEKQEKRKQNKRLKFLAKIHNKLWDGRGIRGNTEDNDKGTDKPDIK